MEREPAAVRPPMVAGQSDKAAEKSVRRLFMKGHKYQLFSEAAMIFVARAIATSVRQTYLGRSCVRRPVSISRPIVAQCCPDSAIQSFIPIRARARRRSSKTLRASTI
eukprot:573153-Prymnesium_polylepis.1